MTLLDTFRNFLYPYNLLISLAIMNAVPDGIPLAFYQRAGEILLKEGEEVHMQEEKDEKKEAQEKAPKKKPSKKVIIIAAAVGAVLLIGGAAGGYFLFMTPKAKHSAGAPQKAEVEKKKSESGEKGEGEGKGEGGGEGMMRPLDAFIVNLTDAQGTRYLKVVMQLEMDNESLGQEIDQKLPEIRDEIIMLLSSKSFDDLSTVPGKRSLKRGIVDSANKYLTTGKIVNVYFSEFVVQ
jgi:flagellar protein FliL